MIGSFKREFRVIIALLLWSCIRVLPAQERLEGRVTDRATGQPLAGAHIILLPGGEGTSTDSSGHFQLSGILPASYHLRAGAVGYREVVLPVVIEKGKMKYLIISLPRDTTRIEAVNVYAALAVMRLRKDPQAEPFSLLPSETVILPADMEKYAPVTLPEALRYVPGGWIESRGRKVKEFFTIRGQTYPYPGYSLNGIIQKEFCETAPFLHTLDIGKITVDRSPAALLKSLSPLTGVIDVQSREIDTVYTAAELFYGSRNTISAGVMHGNGTKAVKYTGSATFYGTDGPPGRNGRERIVHLYGNLRWKIRPGMTMRFFSYWIGGERGLIRPVPPAALKFRTATEHYRPLNTLLTAAKMNYRVSSRLRGEMLVNVALRDPEYRYRNDTSDMSLQYREKDRETTISHISILNLGKHNVMRIGALYNHWVAPNGKRYYWEHPANVHTLSVVGVDQHIQGKWVMDLGIRITDEFFREWSAFSIEGSSKKFQDVEPIRNEWQPPVWQAMGGLSFMQGAAFSLHGNIATGIVTPRKGALTATGEPPRNEKRTNLEIGAVRHCHGNGTLTFNLFFIDRNDAIGYSGETAEADSGVLVELYENRDRRSYGMEAALRRQIIPGRWDIFANLMWMKGEARDSSWTYDDETPRLIWNAGTSCRFGEIRINLLTHYTGRYYNDRFLSKSWLKEHGKMPLGNFVDIDLTLEGTIPRDGKIRLFAGVDNLLDHHYQTVPGWPHEGRSFRSGMRVEF